IFGIGFQTADAIAANLGVLRTSPERAQAGILHVLQALADEGHVAAPPGELVERTKALLEVDVDRVEAALAPLVERGEIVIERGPRLVEAVYLTPLYRAEAGIAELVGRITRAGRVRLQIDIDKAIASFQQRHRLQLAEAP